MESTLRIRITVGGRLSQRLARAFPGLAPVPSTGATELTGKVADQAQLYGVLTRIRDLGLDLQSVTVIDANAGSPRAGSVVGRNASAPRP
jgi:hypothetical protein